MSNSPEINLPEELRRALQANPLANELFNRLAPSHKRRWISHISEAKRGDTRTRRVQRLIDNLIQPQ